MDESKKTNQNRNNIIRHSYAMLYHHVVYDEECRKKILW